MCLREHSIKSKVFSGVLFYHEYNILANGEHYPIIQPISCNRDMAGF